MPARVVRRLPLPLLCLALAGPGIAPAHAGDAADAGILVEIARLREQQAQLARMQQANEEALRALEARLGTATAATMPSPAATATVPAGAPVPAFAAPAQAPAPSRLTISGDVRVRGQFDNSDRDGRDRTSTQFRGRLGATYVVNDRLTVGARLATGDADDPNSVDVQLSNWDDDLQVSLDQAYLQLNLGELKLFGGKMPQPFTRTELVWDGDVNPQGLAATWKHALGDGSAVRAAGLFFVVDEQAGGNDSTMGGVQLGYDSAALGSWKFDASAALYDYSLHSMAGADAGDWRSNLVNPDGTYVSGFRLADVIVGGTYAGLGERWPLRIVGDYVRNTAARTDGDHGWGLDLAVGKAAQPGDWRITYGRAAAGVDAVLAAFSQDNISIGTNYRLHSLGVDYVPWPKTTLSAVWYRYRPYSAAYAGANQPDDWLNRFRISLMVGF